MSYTEDCNKTNKIVVLGESCTGKTSFARRIITDVYVNHYKPTMGTCPYFYKFEFEIFMFIEISGDEYYGSMLNLLINDIDAVIIFCDITNLDTIKLTDKWLNIFRDATSQNDSCIPCYLLINKADQIEKIDTITADIISEIQGNYDRVIKISIKEDKLYDIPLDWELNGHDLRIIDILRKLHDDIKN